jgi:hypothetical protein
MATSDHDRVEHGVEQGEQPDLPRVHDLLLSATALVIRERTRRCRFVER